VNKFLIIFVLSFFLQSCGSDENLIPQAFRRNLIIISDISVCEEGIHEVDDGYNLGYALGTPDAKILAFVASFGNTSSLNAYNCAKYLFEIAGRTDIPVFQGAEGISERWKVTEAIIAIRDIVERYPGQVWIENTGTATDLASFIKNFPDISEKTAGVLFVSGVVHSTEGLPPLDIVNTVMDIDSADYVLKNATNLVVAPLDLTEDVIFSFDLWEQSLKKAESAFTKYILIKTKEWIEMETRFTGGFYPYDSVALAGLFYPEIITKKDFKRLEVNIDPKNKNWSFYTESKDEARPVAEIWFDINEEVFWKTFLKALGL